MLQDLLIILKTKSLLIILSISAFVRLIFYLIYLPSTPSSFGPDEGTYAALANYVALGLPAVDFPVYGANLYNSSRSLILPSAGLIKLGFDALDATRLISSVYGFLSSIFLGLIFLNCYQFLGDSQGLNPKVFKKSPVFFFGLFTFFPSNFLWSTIGLRESASQFFLIATSYFLLKFVLEFGGQKWTYGTFSVFTLMLAHGARPETALIFTLVALIFALYVMMTSRKISPAIVIFLGLTFGQIFTAPGVLSQNELKAFPVVEKSEMSPTAKPQETNQSAAPNTQLSRYCKEIDQIILENQKEYVCKKITNYLVNSRNPAKNLQEQILKSQILESKRNLNALDAQSALPINSCQNDSQEIKTLLQCNLKELPYRLFSFLFRPLPVLDQGSSSMNFAAFENLIWLFLIPFTLYSSLQRHKNKFEKFLNLILFPIS